MLMKNDISRRNKIPERGLSLLMIFCLCSFIVHPANAETSTSVPLNIEKSDIQSPMQKRVIRGVVLDENKQPVPGATVQVNNGTAGGAITDMDGKFSVSVEAGNKITVSFVGYEPQNITIGAQKELTVQLKPKQNELEEVAIVAFAKQKKESVVGSITSVKPAELKVPSSNLTTALAGRVAGMIAFQRSGEPGQDNAQFFVRGVTTFGYKKDPLILLDNNEITTQELASLLTDDIASFSIMKDATATALYGSRGANGVILITTKEGAEGKVKINARFEESFSQPTDMVEWADPITYMKHHNEAVLTRDPLGEVPYSQQKIDNTANGGNPYVYPQNDWYKMLFKDYAVNTRFNMNASGGGKVARYYIAGSYSRDNGILNVDKRANYNNNIDLKRYMLRANVNINMTKTTEVTVRLSGVFDDYTGPLSSGKDIFNSVVNTNPVMFPPYYAPDEANKDIKHILFGNVPKGGYNNPYAEMVRGYREYSQSQMLAQFELKQDLEFITPGLKFRALGNTNRYSYYTLSRSYNPFYYAIGGYDKRTDKYVLAGVNEKEGSETLDFHEGGKQINYAMYFEGALSWDRIFKEKHAVGALLVGTLREYKTANANSLQLSLPSRNLGLAGRVTYAYDNRYFIEGNFGYNGSERFSKNERFGFFPSIGGGWYISNEAFWNDNLKKVISKLKLKATYGLVGNDAIGSASDRFFYISEVNMQNGGKGAYFGSKRNEHYNGISISRYPNDQITWEVAKKLNLGIELGVCDQLEVIADVFWEKRKNILMERSYIPSTMGLQAAIRANVGEAKSRGIDISANYSKFFNRDAWLTGMANFTFATNEYVVFEEPDYSATPWKSHIGQAINQGYGYVAERLFVDDEEVRNSPTQFGGSNLRAGDIKYKDINGDGKITELDMVPLGYPTVPEITYGFGLSGGYKNFDLSFFFQGLGRESFWINANSTAPFIGNQRELLKAYADDHWTEENQNLYALWPRYDYEANDNNTKTSSWFMRDGAFLRLKQVEIGYSLPQKWMHKIHASNMRVYVNGTNLLKFSNFKLWDPEMGGEGLGYPLQRVYNVGIQLSF